MKENSECIPDGELIPSKLHRFTCHQRSKEHCETKEEKQIGNKKIKVKENGNPTKIEKSITPIKMKPNTAGSINSANI